MGFLSDRSATVVGAGIGGLTAAVALARRGARVDFLAIYANTLTTSYFI